jgi:hypothetical protein
MHDAIEPVSRADRQQTMDEIGHHAPREQRVPIAVEGQEGCLNQLGDGRDCQIAPAMPLVEGSIERPNPVLLRSPDYFVPHC